MRVLGSRGLEARSLGAFGVEGERDAVRRGVEGNAQ
jgi:hypothetical protein